MLNSSNDGRYFLIMIAEKLHLNVSIGRLMRIIDGRDILADIY